MSALPDEITQRMKSLGLSTPDEKPFTIGDRRVPSCRYCGKKYGLTWIHITATDKWVAVERWPDGAPDPNRPHYEVCKKAPIRDVDGNSTRAHRTRH